MNHFNHDQQNLINEFKVEDWNSVELIPPYQSWPQRYPGYVPYPRYPPYHQQQFHAINRNDQSPDKKQEIDLSTEEKHQPSPTNCTQYTPQQEPPHSQYPPQHKFSHDQYLPQHGTLPYPPYYPPPHYNSFPPHDFATNNYANPNAYNPMPVWNQNEQIYNHGWQQFRQFQQNPQNMLQNDTSENKDFHSYDSNGDNELDSSFERTSDLGSSLNNSSSGEYSDMSAVPPKLTSSRKYSEWEEDDLTLLAGWKKRSYQQGRTRRRTLYQYISPSLEIFNSRTEIVSFMRNSDDFSEDDVQKVMSGSGQCRTPKGIPIASIPSMTPGSRHRDANLLYKDWVFDETLPTGWKKRCIEFKNRPNRMGKRFKYKYLAPNNRIFTSRIEIVSFMRNSNEFSEDDVQKVLSGSRAGIRDPNHKYPDWENDETLPSGWKRRFKVWKNGDRRSKKYTYLSPNNRIFNSRTDVVSFMRNSEEYSDDDIEKALSGNRQGKGPRGIPIPI